jgi:DNA-binding beta-propeller fold protein YncE
VYALSPAGATLAAEVPVGLEPVAVAARTNAAGRPEAWVVNHLSDSVSIVDVDPVDPARSRVTRTRLVGDEPRDVVLAGTGGDRAFVTAAHRGQNRPGDPQLTTEGVGRADVWAFDADAPGAALGGTPLAIIQLFGDTPRALAVSPDGATVYAAVFHSGNRTTTLLERVVTPNGGLPPPPAGATPDGPDTGLIVQRDGTRWVDELDRDWSALLAFSLPDLDVFRIDADADPAAETGIAVSGVGTILFNMAVRPTTGTLVVSNTEARNAVRFEPVLRGHLTESRITVVDGASVTPVHLNPHVDYDVSPGPESEIAESVAFPTDMVFSPDGATLYVAALGSGVVAALDAAALESGTVVRTLIPVGDGPSGLALDAAHDRLFVMNRLGHGISVVTNLSDPERRAETARLALAYDPSPASATRGRRFLYDAASTSGHGDAACASCHVFGDFDSLAWDLGDPFGEVVPNVNPMAPPFGPRPFHPMKGPMTTQSLRGMAEAGAMHWRADRNGADQPGGDPFDADAAFRRFNPAFVGLLGAGAQLTDPQLTAFTDFALGIQYPPNPIAALDGSLTAAQEAGRDFYTTTLSDGPRTCNTCHALPLGTSRLSANDGEPQDFKIPHLRNAYQKVGMFGLPPGPGSPGIVFGDQVRGVGFSTTAASPPSSSSSTRHVSPSLPGIRTRTGETSSSSS